MMKARYAIGKPDKQGEIKLLDLLEGSALVQSKAVLADMIKYDGIRDWRVRTGGNRLPFNTLECFYETLLLNRVQ